MEAGIRAMKVKDQNAKSKVPSSSAAQPPSSAKGPEPVSIHSDQPTPKASKVNKKSSEAAAVRTPAPSRFTSNEKENDTPSTTGSRGAKQKAAAKLHDMVPDIALFQKEMKRVGGVLHGGRRASADLTPDHNRKRSLSKEVDDGTEDEAIGRPAKKVKKSKDATAMQLLITGDKRWVENKVKEDNERVSLSCR